MVYLKVVDKYGNPSFGYDFATKEEALAAIKRCPDMIYALIDCQSQKIVKKSKGYLYKEEYSW